METAVLWNVNRKGLIYSLLWYCTIYAAVFAKAYSSSCWCNCITMYSNAALWSFLPQAVLSLWGRNNLPANETFTVEPRDRLEQMAPCLKVFHFGSQVLNSTHQWSLGERWEQLQSLTYELILQNDVFPMAQTGLLKNKSGHQRESYGSVPCNAAIWKIFC